MYTCPRLGVPRRVGFQDGVTFSKVPYPIALIAFVRRVGRAGSNASRFLFSQPSGAVITTSSNSNHSPAVVWTLALSDGSTRHKILLTVLPSFTSASSKAGFEIACKIFLWVPAQNRFSEPGQYSPGVERGVFRKQTSFDTFFQPEELEALFLNWASYKGAPHFSHLKHNFPFSLGIAVRVRYPLDNLSLEEVPQALVDINSTAVFVRKTESILNDIPHDSCVLFALGEWKEVAELVVHIRLCIPSSKCRLRLLGDLQDRVVPLAVDPVGAKVYEVSVMKGCLVDSPADPVPSF